MEEIKVKSAPRPVPLVIEPPPSNRESQTSDQPSTPNNVATQYIKHVKKSSNGGSAAAAASSGGANKIKTLKNKSRSIPVLVAQELNGNNGDSTTAKSSTATDSPKVVFRSKSFNMENKIAPIVDMKANRYSEPIEMPKDLHIRLPHSSPSKPIASVQPTTKTTTTTTTHDDELKRRSALLNSQTFKSNINLDTLTSRNTVNTDYDELFDPSIVFLSSFRCHYYDMNRRIRKGKLLLSANELVFKCSGMPFVKAHLKYEHIVKLTTMDQHENIKHKFLCIEYNHLNKLNLNFYFYHFLMPIKLVKMNIRYLIKKSNKYLNVDVPETPNSSKIPGLKNLKSFILTNIHQQRDENDTNDRVNTEMMNTTPQSNESPSTTTVFNSQSAPVPVPIPVPRMRNKKNSDAATAAAAADVAQPPPSTSSKYQVQNENNNKQKQSSLVLASTTIKNTEFQTVKKTTAITTLLFTFMVIFIVLNFFKLSELEREINDYE